MLPKIAKKNARPRGAVPGGFPARVLLPAILVSILFISCPDPGSLYIEGDREQRHELKTLFALYEKHDPQGKAPDAVRRFAAARGIARILVRQGLNERAAAFLLQAAGAVDDYSPWYMFGAAACYEAAQDGPLALQLYGRIVKTMPDLEIEGKSIHYESLQRLVLHASAPASRIEYLRDLIARFPSSPDIGAYYFLLAKEYEKVSEWDEALANYARFLPYFGAAVPGYPDALEQARRMVEFNASPKDWTYASLDELVKGIRKALRSGSARQLRKFASKSGFFAVSWYQDTGDAANSRVDFDLGQLMRGSPIQASPTLHPSSGPYEAYLRTWGWAGRVPVWYLYFRKINFPADPAVHGQWEWAGIYFGEKLQ